MEKCATHRVRGRTLLHNEATQNHPACSEASHWEKERPDCRGGLFPAKPRHDLRTKSFISLFPLCQLPKNISTKHNKRNSFIPTLAGDRAVRGRGALLRGIRDAPLGLRAAGLCPYLLQWDSHCPGTAAYLPRERTVSHPRTAMPI